MEIISLLISAALTLTSVHNMNAELPDIANSFTSKALLCAGDEINDLSEEADSYLRSYDDARIKITNSHFVFNGSSRVDELFLFTDVRNQEALSYNVSFDATYLFGLDICIIDIGLISQGEEIMKESAFVLPFVDRVGNIDSKIVMNGFKYYRSELFNGNTPIQNPYFNISAANNYSGIFLKLEEDLLGLTHDTSSPHPLNETSGGGIVNSLIAISDAIRGVDRVIGFAAEHITIPLISHGTSLDWLFFKAKMLKMRDNFIHNSLLDSPYQKNISNQNHPGRAGKYYIYNQNDYIDWNYSFFGSLNNQGCGVVAAYNMLVDCNRNCYVDLPTLIALFEIMNADTLFGCFGTNMIPVEYLQTLEVYSDNLVEEVILRLTANLGVAYHESGAPFLREIENLGYNFCGLSDSVTSLSSAFLVFELIFSTIAVIDYYFSIYKHDVGFIIGLYIGNDYTHTAINYNDFIGHQNLGRQSIVCFWVGLTLGDTIDFIQGAHFVYICKNESGSIYSCYNLYSNSSLCAEKEYDRIFELFYASSSYIASLKMISSYTFFLEV